MPPSSGQKCCIQLEKTSIKYVAERLVLKYSTLKMQHISTELSSPPTKLQGLISQKIANSRLINYLLTKRSINLQGEMSSTSA
jgi:hypothetical protein